MSQKTQVIAAVYGKENDAGRVVGQSLKSLREAVGYTQLQMAERLGIGQAAISKIEARGDVQISSLKKYVETLGASLRIEAAFSADSEVSARLRGELQIEEHSDRQLVLPIFSSDELISEATKDLIISIHPHYSEKILEGKKTVELRRRFPISTAKGTKIYIYSTSPVRAIVGCAEISEIIKLPIQNMWKKYSKSAFIKNGILKHIFEGLAEGFALELTNAKTFENPINLKELRERFNFTPPQSFIYAKQEVRRPSWMSRQIYLIDTNVIIGLEDNKTVQPVFAAFIQLATKNKVGVFIHAAAKDDIARDKNIERRNISASKLEKFSYIDKVRGLDASTLGEEFGQIRKPNDVVDVTLLHALHIGAADFLVTQDRGLHERARRHSSELGRRVLHIADAVDLLQTTFEPKESPVRFVEEIAANTIPLTDKIFDSLREDYAPFDQWWKEKCVREHRQCWIVADYNTKSIAGLIVRKDETPENTDARLPANKILKICTFKVRPESRGVKLGELLLKKVFWFAQKNAYDLAYVTTYKTQNSLIDLLEYYGFQHTATKQDGELIYEKLFSQGKLSRKPEQDLFTTAKLNYPRFVTDPYVRAFGIPIKEGYHDTLYPDLKFHPQGDLFENAGIIGGPQRPGNTIRKVYLCRAKSKLGGPGSLLFFYKGKSKHEPSQAITTVGIFEEVASASSTKELMTLSGGRSVYSEKELESWKASPEDPIKVINYLLVGYIDPPVSLTELQEIGVFGNHPPQSIFEIKDNLKQLLLRAKLGFET